MIHVFLIRLHLAKRGKYKPKLKLKQGALETINCMSCYSKVQKTLLLLDEVVEIVNVMSCSINISKFSTGTCNPDYDKAI